ncbi:hypothetical protein [Gilvimarinus sp. DA14]|uniref:hypothetical protein n=1 Tax=Gilvimarinus sp. DA14 TaxID=2956798 RepID=UPI0020B69394|nr:hypothetical protein [Gilvimarinus sp. DA14]UTF61534.1 hypothetical protein NHM04_06990 [Gilvimarinus sp. DA14]
MSTSKAVIIFTLFCACLGACAQQQTQPQWQSGTNPATRCMMTREPSDNGYVSQCLRRERDIAIGSRSMTATFADGFIDSVLDGLFNQGE